MRNTVVVFVAFCVLAACTPKSYPLNEQPMYGNAPKTPAMIKADEKFIVSIEELGYTRTEGACELARRASDALGEGDFKTAIKRYNQAWLLDGQEYHSYWGFALVSLLRDKDTGMADRMFAKALSLEPDTGNFYVEYGRFTAEHKPGGLDEAIALFERGLEMNPKIRDGYIGLISAYGSRDDIESAHQWYLRGKGQGVFPAEEAARFDASFREVGKQ